MLAREDQSNKFSPLFKGSRLNSFGQSRRLFLHAGYSLAGILRLVDLFLRKFDVPINQSPFSGYFSQLLIAVLCGNEPAPSSLVHLGDERVQVS